MFPSTTVASGAHTVSSEHLMVLPFPKANISAEPATTFLGVSSFALFLEVALLWGTGSYWNSADCHSGPRIPPYSPTLQTECFHLMGYSPYTPLMWCRNLGPSVSLKMPAIFIFPWMVIKSTFLQHQASKVKILLTSPLWVMAVPRLCFSCLFTFWLLWWTPARQRDRTAERLREGRRGREALIWLG